MFFFVFLNLLLNINLELVFFKLVIDVCGDLKVVKKILEEGESFVVVFEEVVVIGKFFVYLLYVLVIINLCCRDFF